MSPRPEPELRPVDDDERVVLVRVTFTDRGDHDTSDVLDWLRWTLVVPGATILDRSFNPAMLDATGVEHVPD
jgi:hypothetical protein